MHIHTHTHTNTDTNTNKHTKTHETTTGFKPFPGPSMCTLQHTATYTETHSVTHCNTLQHTETHSVTHHKTLPHTATHSTWTKPPRLSTSYSTLAQKTHKRDVYEHNTHVHLQA